MDDLANAALAAVTVYLASGAWVVAHLTRKCFANGYTWRGLLRESGFVMLLVFGWPAALWVFDAPPPRKE